MVAIKPADADRTLARPDPAFRVILVHGSDEGLVSERAARFARTVLGEKADPLSHVRLDSVQIADDPGRLADEANAMGLFGGERVISVRVSGNRQIDGAVKAMLDAPPQDSWIILAAGELRKTSPLRKLCETHRHAWAIASYADGDRDLDRIIDEETAASSLSITPEARTALKGLLGSDRMISRNEVRKLCLYADGKGTVDLDDVRDVVGDVGAFAIDETVDAVAAGDGSAVDVGLRRLMASGTPSFVVVGAALRYFTFLEKARAALDGGKTTQEIVQRAIPPIFFARQAIVTRAINNWSQARITRALTVLDRAMLDSRRNGAIAEEIAAQALHLVTTLAGGRPRR